ncbi:FmdE family protein [Ramlibacter sp. AN1133]|uniref:FmdE family protein n=1 Tax=Ramlibacter sp. AN1133 TaxID=3133429 RepID=UPI0030BB183E
MPTDAFASFPSFFDEAPTIRVQDPLAEFLGAVRGGLLEYCYADAVQFAGHSCPTVASAFLMTRAALRALYPDTLPRRGELRVELREPAAEGVTGVIGGVAGFLTGAAGESGFHGIGGRFARQGLLAYDAPIGTQLRFTRLDTGASVGVSADLMPVAGDPRVMQLMPLCLRGLASPEEQEAFRAGWQDRVRRLLLEHADDPEVIVLERESEAVLADAAR